MIVSFRFPVGSYDASSPIQNNFFLFIPLTLRNADLFDFEVEKTSFINIITLSWNKLNLKFDSNKIFLQMMLQLYGQLSFLRCYCCSLKHPVF